MEGGCKRCKKWEEHFYWNHVDARRMHFYKVMFGDFSEHMSIPKKFVNHFKGELSENVDLKSPSGNIWHVGLTKSSGGMILQSGWKDFVEAHNLEEKDLLVFKFDGKSCFDILMFDGSGCEKAASYFVRSKESRKRERSEDSVEILNLTPRHKEIHCSFSSVSHDDIPQELLLSIPHKTSRRKQKAVNKNQRVGSSCRKRIVKSNKFSVHARNKRGKLRKNVGTSKGTRDHIKQEPVDMYNHGKLTLADLFVSTKMGRLTETEEKKVLQLAHAVQSDNPFFISIMRPSMVRRISKSYLTVPSAFVELHLPSQTQRIYLQTDGQRKKWPVSYLVQKRSAGLSGGWKYFVDDNNLDEGDVCLFELIESGREIVMNVNIIRAADHVD